MLGKERKTCSIGRNIHNAGVRWTLGLEMKTMHKISLRLRMNPNQLSLNVCHAAMEHAVVTWRRGRQHKGKNPVWGAVLVGMEHLPPKGDDKGECRAFVCDYAAEVDMNCADLVGNPGAVQKALHEVADAFRTQLAKFDKGDSILDGKITYNELAWHLNVHQGGVRVTPIAA